MANHGIKICPKFEDFYFLLNSNSQKETFISQESETAQMSKASPIF